MCIYIKYSNRCPQASTRHPQTPMVFPHGLCGKKPHRLCLGGSNRTRGGLRRKKLRESKAAGGKKLEGVEFPKLLQRCPQPRRVGVAADACICRYALRETRLEAHA